MPTVSKRPSRVFPGVWHGPNTLRTTNSFIHQQAQIHKPTWKSLGFSLFSQNPRVPRQSPYFRFDKLSCNWKSPLCPVRMPNISTRPSEVFPGVRHVPNTLRMTKQLHPAARINFKTRSAIQWILAGLLKPLRCLATSALFRTNPLR